MPEPDACMCDAGVPGLVANAMPFVDLAGSFALRAKEDNPCAVMDRSPVVEGPLLVAPLTLQV